MRQAEQKHSPYQPIDMSQWRQDVNTFVVEMQSELTQMIDELSNRFSAVGCHTSPPSARSASQDDVVFQGRFATSETDSEEADNA